MSHPEVEKAVQDAIQETKDALENLRTVYKKRLAIIRADFQGRSKAGLGDKESI